MYIQRCSNFNPQCLRSLALAALSLGVTALVTGCSGNMPGNFGVPVVNPSSGKVSLTGSVYGGQQPITGALIQLYTVGTSGLGSASTALIPTTVTTSDGTATMDSNANAGNAYNTLPAGSFTITGDYNCSGTAPETTPGTQVYMTATGGNPSAGVNSAINMVVALGSCATLLQNAATTFINMDEVTTIAAAYALAPFAVDYQHIGASGSNPTGLVNAFGNAAVLANPAYGVSGGANLATGVTVPTTELNTLANIIAACVNTTGSSSAQCVSLFGATGVTDTFKAAIAIAKNPGASAITGLYTLSSTSAPFQPSITFTQAPNDFTVAVTMAGNSSLSSPYGIAIDGSGNAWVTNEAGTTVTEFSPSGTVLATPTATGLVGAQGIAIDKGSANVWVANTAGNSVIQFGLSGGAVSSTNVYTSNISAPSAIALDSAGNAFIANFNGNSVTELSSAGANQNGSPFTGSGNNIVNPTGIAVGSTGGPVYVTSGNGYIVQLSNTGAYTATLTDSTLQGPASVAVGNSSQVVATGFTTGTAVGGALGEYASGGSAASNSPVATSFTNPAGVATDYTYYYVANGATSGSLAQYAYNTSSPVSPTAGYGSLNAPVGVAVDPSGSVWTANSGSNTLSVFIGLASPTQTPIAANVGP